MKTHPLVKKVLFNKEQINNRISELAKEIADFYNNKNGNPNEVILIGLLKGCAPFYTEFCLNFDYQMIMDFMVVSSYVGGFKSNKSPKINLDTNLDVSNKKIIIVDDIIDTGHTIKFVKDYLMSKKAKDVKVLTLLDKPAGREIDLKADWVGFTIEKEFVIGYGLDYEERLRNLPYIAICDTDKLKNWSW